MTNHDDEVFDELFDTADQVLAEKSCNDAKADLENVAADATKVVKDNLQKAVDTKCNYNSGADQERIRDTKKREN